MTKVEIIQGDITKVKVDAIVNAANKTLLGGGGVDGAIHLAAGPELYQECQYTGGCETGEAKITKGYNLFAKYIIHTVGPVYSRENGREAELLKNCYTNSLEIARANKVKTIAFPAISTGVFRYPKKDAAKIAVNTVKDYINKFPNVFDKIIFVLYTESDYKIYESILK